LIDNQHFRAGVFPFALSAKVAGEGKLKSFHWRRRPPLLHFSFAAAPCVAIEERAFGVLGVVAQHRGLSCLGTRTPELVAQALASFR
jgi:hypothetical protein